MTQGLGLAPAGGQNVITFKGCTITKAALQDSLSKCLSQPDLRVARLESHPERNHVEVVLKWAEGRSKMMLEVCRVGGEGDHQAHLLLGPISKISRYLEEALESPLTLQYIPLPRFFNIEEPQLEEGEEEKRGEKSKLENGLETVLGIEIPGPSGFLSLSQGALADYEHSALTISAIARLRTCSHFSCPRYQKYLGCHPHFKSLRIPTGFTRGHIATKEPMEDLSVLRKVQWSEQLLLSANSRSRGFQGC